MDIIRRNTDYALRILVNLAASDGEIALSTRHVARQNHIPYPLACKIMQKLHNDGFVKSAMGPKGGFSLSKKPAKIALLSVIETIQGPLKLNRCLLGVDVCPLQDKCPISIRLKELQNHIETYLNNITLQDLVNTGVRLNSKTGSCSRKGK